MELVYSLNQLDKAANELVSTIGESRVVTLEGEMGAGKTTLIQAACRIMGVRRPMGSPTFSIINEYPTESGSIYHIDLYRCRSAEEAVRAGVEECLYSGNLCLVEWPSKAEEIFPESTLRLTISQLEDDRRKIVVHCKK